MQRIDIATLADQRGTHSLRFHIPVRPLHTLHEFGLSLGFTSSDDPSTIRPCVANETHYKVTDGYKITLQPVDPATGERDDKFAQETYYLQDLESIMARNPEDFRLEIVGLGDDVH